MTTQALAGLIAVISLLIGLKEFLLIELPVIYIATVCGVWLFYVQHQFQGVHSYWQEASDPSGFGCGTKNQKDWSPSAKQ